MIDWAVVAVAPADRKQHAERDQVRDPQRQHEVAPQEHGGRQRGQHRSHRHQYTTDCADQIVAPDAHRLRLAVGRVGEGVFIQQLALGSPGDRLQDRVQLFGNDVDALLGGRRRRLDEILPAPPAWGPSAFTAHGPYCSAGGIEVMAAGAVMEPAPYGARFAMIASASPPERICNWLPVIWNVAADWSAARNCCSCCITPAGDSQAILVVIGGLTDSVLPPAW